MGGSDQPFLYDPAPNSRPLSYPYSDFNPRAATQSHYAAMTERAERQKRKAAQDGRPLINFNQHPDSYMVVNNPTVDHKPLSPSTKRNIIWTRWSQFVLRLFQEIGALGILVCVICLKMKNDGPGWIIRVAPAWDAVITMYAIYHLLRPAKNRTPASSASYHFFALFMDTGLIPFYVFIALFARQNWEQAPADENRWTSFFSTTYATTTVIWTTFIASIVVGGLHLVSILLDLYLIVMFRKIANLPPDLNPLEDNLTGSGISRSRSSRHKYKNSEMSTASTLSGEKGHGYHLSGSTLSGGESRNSLLKEPEVRVVPWSHSRTNLDNTYSGHNPESARLSRQQYDDFNLHQGPRSGRSSRQDVGEGHRSRAGTVVTPNENTDVFDFGDIPPVSSFNDRPNSFHSARGNSSDRMPTASPNTINRTREKEGLLNDNWYVLDEQDASDLGSPRRQGKPAPPYSVEPTLPNVQLERADSFNHQPLKMNPPTPPMSHDEFPDPGDQDVVDPHHGHYNPIETGVARTLTVQSHATNASSVYSESAPSLRSDSRPNNFTPKGKFYGDLSSATRGVRGVVPIGQTHFPEIQNMGRYGVPTPQSSRTPSPQKQGGRVVSRTGTDIADAQMYAQQNLRGRNVSGKVAEEGRGGAWR
ncbi:hypothetical protein CLAFUW4_03189 [Fulvia fulva]|uniref:Uncharacterized protein n=1 Tax=Passalora fulva TaxID=5499 RepID=A0A9Q8P577_PASFU|nr:uncharacterized protein CLAFUR5_03173 [Fulvia fulva]KAK4632405.1 hypothetical protein CLAFUR4_03178 [Fulvia fulva]KAK4632889.1 hypothetical protein CLAFUR0_03182 [Fulvia fulva]UJO13845.1 hypothetical protein CLAFUR5_03173 [Fulvia fulva]WPV11342.1 hypothetical protein CLAFUW4_03189 [Fulvia fulva]WPV25416.1 hypothetical protein CLAFUW7_03182 [Fulvia fulva]